MNLSQEFYRNYQANFFRYQQIINQEALDKVDYWTEKFNDEGYTSDKDQVSQIIRSHIRVTYLHCIDTLFELVCGLFPRNDRIQDEELPFIISKNNDAFNKPIIQGIAEKNALTLKEIYHPIHFGKHSIPLVQYIIYYQISIESLIDKSLYSRIEESIEPIIDLLSIFACDIADKSEYNSLKHALRAFPFNGFFKIVDPGTNKPIAGMDFKNAQKYLYKSENEYRIVTKNFNTQRDYAYTMVASNMIWNIIKAREIYLSSINKPGIGSLFVYFFSTDDYCDLEKSIDHKQKLEIKVKTN